MYDIFFIGEQNKEYYKLKEKYITLKHVTTAEEATQKAMTRFFWIVWDDLLIKDDFHFDYKPDEWSKKMPHMFLNGEYYDGVMLLPKRHNVSIKEFKHRFVVARKEVDTIISQPVYDIVYISYNEVQADENYKKLCDRFPRAKRVHGVKGIHQAHIEAAKLCDTKMFWVVDADAIVVDDFDFSYQVPAWNHDQVFVWRSKNPINDLIYGYGGIKLFPRQQTIDMDLSKPDMTTSISTKFNAVQTVSNITAFNVDPWSTWKSAFRECSKLSSKIIDRQKNDETLRRLGIWKTVGTDRPFGKYAIAGAIAGEEYGTANKDDIEKLKKINDFDWLKEQYESADI